MNTFSKLNRLLNAPTGIADWEDNQKFIAQDLLEDFQESDWAHLEETWQTQNADWQERLCQVLGAPHPHRVAIEILMQILEGSDSNLSLYAADALREFDEAELQVCRNQILARLDQEAPTQALAQRIYGALRQKLGD